MSKNIGKIISKNLSSKCSQNLIDCTKESATDALKIAPKRAVQKTAEATGDLIGIKLPIKFEKSQKLHRRIIQKQKKKKKYLEKHVHLQNKDRELFMI